MYDRLRVREVWNFTYRLIAEANEYIVTYIFYCERYVRFIL
jgi:hypothetical protein